MVQKRKFLGIADAALLLVQVGSAIGAYIFLARFAARAVPTVRKFELLLRRATIAAPVSLNGIDIAIIGQIASSAVGYALAFGLFAHVKILRKHLSRKNLWRRLCIEIPAVLISVSEGSFAGILIFIVVTQQIGIGGPDGDALTREVNALVGRNLEYKVNQDLVVYAVLSVAMLVSNVASIGILLFEGLREEQVASEGNVILPFTPVLAQSQSVSEAKEFASRFSSRSSFGGAEVSPVMRTLIPP